MKWSQGLKAWAPPPREEKLPRWETHSFLLQEYLVLWPRFDVLTFSEIWALIIHKSILDISGIYIGIGINTLKNYPNIACWLRQSQYNVSFPIALHSKGWVGRSDKKKIIKK